MMKTVAQWLIVFLMLLLPPRLLVLAEPSYGSIRLTGAYPYYEPFVAVVPAGTPMRWVNESATHHTVKHDGCLAESDACLFDSGTLPPEADFVISPLPPGRYPYHCELHPIMRGLLIVDAEARQAATETAIHQHKWLLEPLLGPPERRVAP